MPRAAGSLNARHKEITMEKPTAVSPASQRNQPPTELRPAIARLIRRARQCKPASSASRRLFAQKIAEATIANPHAGPVDARAARWLLEVLRTQPATVHMLLPDRHATLFREGGR